MSAGSETMTSSRKGFERLVPHQNLPLVAGISSEQPEVHVFELSDISVATRAVVTTSIEPYPDEPWKRPARVPSACWHPEAPLLVVTSDEGLMQWTPDTISPLPGPPTDRSYRWLAFDGAGARLWASPASGDDGWESSDIFDPATGEVTPGPRWDTGLSRHPSDQLVTTLNSDQGATLVLFATHWAGEAAGLGFLDRALILDADGYEAPLFSPDGTMFAIRGNAYEQSLEVFDLVTLRRIFGTVLGDPSPGYPYPDEWQRQFQAWSTTNICWAASGDLLVGTPTGSIVSVNISDGTAQVAHDVGAPVRALAACASGEILVSLANGELRRITAANTPSPDSSAAEPNELARQFIETCRYVPALQDFDDSLRLTDGVNSWEPGELGNMTTSSPDDPAWYQLQALMNSARDEGT